jgi:Mg-chelatase subunit ChlD
MIRRRQLEIFSLSFLDAMACGFGAAVLLFFMIIKNAAPDQLRESQEQNKSEVTRVELELREGRELLADLRNSLQLTDDQIAHTESLADTVAVSLRTNEAALKEAQANSKSTVEVLAALKKDLQAIDVQAKKLRKEAQPEGGQAARSFVGEGDRQYLTGLRVGGDHILILLDASASMLDETIVNVIRRRNMPDDQKLQSRKWQRAVKSVEWLVSQLPLQSQFQIYAFNTSAQPLVADTASKWLDVSDTARLEAAAKALHQLIPAGGTSLINAFTAAAAFDPKPDNILLITDGLPTQGTSPPLRKSVSADARLKLFEQAARALPTNVPVNTLLLPMEGDPRSSSAYWQLAQVTTGSMISPAADWP